MAFKRIMVNLPHEWLPFFHRGRETTGFNSDSKFIRFVLAKYFIEQYSEFRNLPEIKLRQALD